jgi:PIN domain nuclease of toxin-antitoxin system
LIDTHVIVRWLGSPNKLSREQARVLRAAVRRPEPLGVSAMSLLELAVLFGTGRGGIVVPLDELFHQLKTNDAFQVLPLTIAVAEEVAAMGDALRDPGDRAIVATARVNKLRLVTSDQRIIDSRLVSVVA